MHDRELAKAACDPDPDVWWAEDFLAISWGASMMREHLAHRGFEALLA